MPLTLGSTIASLSTIRVLDRTGGNLASTFERLSSGQRINRASDDSAGLSVATSLNLNARVFTQGIRNINDGISLMAIAEGALGSLQDIIIRVGELANQAANGTLSPKQRSALDREADSLLTEYNRIIKSTSFNGLAILDGSNDTVTLQHGIGVEQTTVLGIGQELGVAAGDGTFAATSALSVGSNPYSVVTADFNRDGKLDIVTADSGASTSVLLGNGNGTFQARQSYGVGSAPNAVLAVDLNNDGNVDVVTKDSGDGTISVLLGKGDGTFQARSSFVAGTSSSFRNDLLKSGDINNDGIVDIIEMNGQSFNQITVLIGNGDGSFKRAQTFDAGIALVQSGGRSLNLGDYDGNGTTDVAIAGQGFDLLGSVVILSGNGDGTFGPRRLAVTGTTASQQLESADFTNDGILDLVTAGTFSSSMFLFVGNGDGTFQAAATLTLSFSSSGRSTAIGDVNGDGEFDIVAGDVGASSVSILIGNGNGTFSASRSYTTSAANTELVLGDLNLDGVSDIVSTGSTSTVSVLLGNADANGRRDNFVDAVDLKTIPGARAALDWTKTQQTRISRELGMLGAYQSRLKTTLSVADTSRRNSEAAASRISDTDVAVEAAEMVRLQILQRAGGSVLAQSNVQPQIALRLLTG